MSELKSVIRAVSCPNTSLEVIPAIRCSKCSFCREYRDEIWQGVISICGYPQSLATKVK